MHLLDPSNEKILGILNCAFEPMHQSDGQDMQQAFLQLQVQLYEILFQHMLASNKGAITPMIFKAVQIQLVDYQSFLWFKIQCAISISTVERASQMQYAHQEMEWTLQQIEHQQPGNATQSLKAGPLWQVLRESLIITGRYSTEVRLRISGICAPEIWD